LEEEKMGKENVTETMDEFFEYTAKFGQQYPEIAQSFMSLMGSVITDGKLGSKEKELIAVGIAVGLRCVPCIYAHTKAALGMGASKEEIMEAASVAILMSGGPGMAHVVEVMKALEAASEG
jgi:AhpD family alkylhydroperoxidase